MRYLLDTHVWLWMHLTPDRLGAHARTVLQAARNRFVLSAASAWEIAIKHALGKVELPERPETYVPDRMRRGGVEGLPVEHAHALRAGALDALHRDPFDRLLVAQAELERLPLLSADPVFARYGVDVVDATR